MKFMKRCLALLSVAILAGCGQNSLVTSNPKPDEALIKAKISDEIPAFLTVKELKLDIQPDGQKGWQIKWDATTTPKEALYVEGGSITPPPKSDGTVPEPKKLIKMAQKPDQSFNLYGKLTATKVGETWTLKSKTDSGLAQFGDPKGDFDSTFLVEGSPEHLEILKEIDELKQAEEKKKALLAEMKKKEEDAKNQKYAKAKEAFPEGLVMKGNLSSGSYNNVAMDVTMTVQGIAGDTWIIVISDPSRPAVKQTFEGKFAPFKGDEGEGDLPSLVLTSLGSQNLTGENIPKFFTVKRELTLTLKATGIDGISKDVYAPFTLTFRN